MAKVSIQFIRCCSPYNEGDKAGFTSPIADKYVRTGVARYVTTAVGVAPVTKEAPPSEPVNAEPSPPSVAEEPVSEPKPVKKKKKKRTRIFKKDS